MNREDIEFLRELQNELRTQTNDGNAQPVYWSVMEKREILQHDDCGEPRIFDGEDMMLLDEAVAMIEDHFDKEEWTEDEKKEWDETTKTDFYEVKEFMNYWLGDDFEVVYISEEDHLSEDTGAFLTKRACQQYIAQYGYNHRKPRAYAMTAYRNFELERLLSILTNMNIDDIKVE